MTLAEVLEAVVTADCEATLATVARVLDDSMEATEQAVDATDETELETASELEAAAELGATAAELGTTAAEVETTAAADEAAEVAAEVAATPGTVLGLISTPTEAHRAVPKATAAIQGISKATRPGTECFFSFCGFTDLQSRRCRMTWWSKRRRW